MSASTATEYKGLLPWLSPFTYPRPASDYAALINQRWQRLAAANERLPAKVVGVILETDNTVSLELKTRRGWRGHRAGQFVTLYVNIDGVWQNRCYSITSSDQQRRRIQLTVRAIGGGRVSHYIVRRLRVGETLHIGQAQGEFTLPQASDKQRQAKLFITAGSGITPVMGMLQSQATQGHCVHIHYERSAHNMPFGNRLRELALQNPNYQLIEVHTAQGGEHFSSQQLHTLCPDWSRRQAWVCGPAALLDSAETHWREAGLGQQLHTERFRAILQHNTAATGGQVQFAHSNISADNRANETLLETAERSGLSPKQGCRMGICHSCDCTLVSGAVRDLRSGQLIDQAGVQIQPCISAAAGQAELAL